MCERQVDLGLGRGLKPGALSVSKEAEEDSIKDLSSKFFWKKFLEEKRTRRRTTTGVIDISQAMVPRPRDDKDPTSELSKTAELSLQLQLQSALQEVEVLRQELDSYRKQLDSKHSAIRILRQQIMTTTVQLDELNHRNVHMRRDMNTEINRLQFELEYNQNILMESQQTWSQRFDRVCQENVRQQSALNARSDEIRQLTEERKALVRDREELMALLDADKRSQWCASVSSIAVRAVAAAASDSATPSTSCHCAGDATQAADAVFDPSPVFDTNGGCSAVEVAVLGACVCRDRNPCRCAQAAARLKREVVSARETAMEARQKAEDAYIVVDAYRNAFEEQLSRNRALTMRMGELAARPGHGSSRVARLKALVTWVGRQLHELGVSGSRGEARKGRRANRDSCAATSGWQGFPLRRSTSVEDLGMAAGVGRPGGALSASSWSISESVVSGGLLGGPVSGGDEGGDGGGDGGESGADADDLDCGRGPGVADKGYTAAGGALLVPGGRELDDEELMAMLLDKLCERTESVAHQRITARVLKRPGATSRRPRATRTDVSSGIFSATSSEMPSPSS